MEIDDKENVMENLQAVIDWNMAEAQCDDHADDLYAQIWFFECAANAFAIKSFVECGMIAKARERFTDLDDMLQEDIAEALDKQMGLNWTEKTFGEFG